MHGPCKWKRGFFRIDEVIINDAPTSGVAMWDSIKQQAHVVAQSICMWAMISLKEPSSLSKARWIVIADAENTS